MKEVFNVENTGYTTKKYPLFLGEKLGLFDTVNIAYPEIEELYQKQLAAIWNEFEVGLEQDKMDMLRLPSEITDLMKQTISWQYTADSIAAKSISELLLPHCTNSEFEGMIVIQNFFEIIHSRTYAHIVKQTMNNPAELLKQTYDNVEIIKRSKVIGDAFGSLSRLDKNSSKLDKQKALLRVMVALMTFEGVSFMSSFAVTFAIAETGAFQGISTLVSLICRDELYHATMDFTVLKILLRDPEWQIVFELIKPEIKAIMDEVVMQEHRWTDYLFSDGRKVIGLSAPLLKEFTNYMALPLYQSFGIDYGFLVVKHNPLPYMDKYIDPSLIQAAAQEIQLSEYSVGAIADDSADLDLENLDF
jgi:ribonucleoside-diphosphate reductase beta chain